MPNTYLITYPNGSQISAQGTSISTSVVTVIIPPPLPSYFYVYATRSDGVNVQPGFLYSYSQPYIVMQPYFSSGFCRIFWYGTNAQGQQTSGYDPFNLYRCASGYVTPGTTTTTRCNVQIGDGSGNIYTIPGEDGVACPTWTTTPDGDCLPTQIKCPSTTDPRGYCCIDCSDLVGKLNTLVV